MKSQFGRKSMRAFQQPLGRLLTLVLMFAGAEQVVNATKLEIRVHQPSDDLPILGDLADSAQLQLMQEKMDMVRLDTERQVYEKKLKQQMDENAVLARQAAQLKTDVAQIEIYNSKFVSNAKKLQEGNEERRQEIKLLSEQLENSASLMQATADATDSDQYKELEVLKPSGAFIQIETDEKSEALSSLAWDIISGVSAPEASHSLALITQSQRSRKEKEEELKRSFLERRKVGEEKHEELLRGVEALNKTLVSQKTYADRLITATKRLKQIRSRLVSQLKEVRQFISRMGGYVEQKGVVPGKKAQVAVEQLQALKKEQQHTSLRSGAQQQLLQQRQQQQLAKKSPDRPVDKHPNCASWAARGECKRNPPFMLADCSAACAGEQKGVVAAEKAQVALKEDQALKKDQAAEKKSPGGPANKHPNCASWAARGECKRNPHYMLADCSAACAGK